MIAQNAQEERLLEAKFFTLRAALLYSESGTEVRKLLFVVFVLSCTLLAQIESVIVDVEGKSG
jgi:hypothetical protein